MAVCPANPTTTRPKEAMLNGLKIPQFAASEALTMKNTGVFKHFGSWIDYYSDTDAPDFVDIVAA